MIAALMADKRLWKDLVVARLRATKSLMNIDDACSVGVRFLNQENHKYYTFENLKKGKKRNLYYDFVKFLVIETHLSLLW